MNYQDTTRNGITASTLKVPGASLYYETRGSGPVLLIIAGGPQDAGVFADVARHLADRYTVVAYDPRGNSRSTFDGQAEAQSLDVHGDDAARLIEALGVGPAYVFGTSGGAQIGLNLAARHPQRVRVLVAHEPPSMMMLDDPSQAVAGMRDLHDTYRSHGVEAAMQKFFSDNGLSEGPDHDEAGQEDTEQPAAPQFASTPEEVETFARVSGNFEYWLAHGIMPLSLYRPDVEALRGAPVVVGIGEDSVGQPIDDMGKALADKLGTKRVAFPGDHMGFAPYPDRFAETLHSALSGAGAKA
ncbi:alpha/beta fold hydrolase [Mesorhizobium waimense]|uniref:Alpha/beta fold hydrolase n=1 Tax=Mesorhizobium waimense TaxID=1300307 RepID=A0A3A5L9G0_9HYPH|nr:alpha/beta hydrolase [Mesorhizobium waimense]RJT42326.1 alpha/beta fold hydrolase [Mesorhizobium waimense]